MPCSIEVNTMPVSRKKGRKNAWRVYLQVNGRQRERVVEGSKADAEAEEARWKIELRTEAPSSPSGSTFSAFCLHHYRPHAEMHLKASTWSVRRYHLATLIGFFGEMKLGELTMHAVEAFKKMRLGAGAKPVSINNELAVLQAVLTFARKAKVPVANVALERLPERGRGRVTFWTDAQVSALYGAVEEHAAELLGLVVFLANTGCRKGEALAAEREWIDLRAGLIRIPVTEEWTPKDDEPREVPISDALRPWLERAVAGGGRWLFPSSKGERFACWPKLQFDRARRAAGLRGGPHTLRHTFATHFLRAEPDVFLLAKILGHSHERTTKLYAHLLPDHMERARNVVNLAPPAVPAAIEARRRWARTGS